MADKSAIEWTDATWNPVVGCSILSPGCTNCYAMKMAARIERMHAGKTHYAGTTQSSKAGAVWTGNVTLAPERILTQPLRWKRGRRIFVNSMGDLFHESIPDEWIDRVFAVMALCPQHTFQVLTKRAKRMRDYFANPRRQVDVGYQCGAFANVGIVSWSAAAKGTDRCDQKWPLPNLWLGVSTERQQEADERIPLLLQTPAAVRFISAEPLLGPLDLKRWMPTGRWGSFKGEPVYHQTYFMTKCERCGWFGSSELAGTASYGDDADPICPQCNESFMCDDYGDGRGLHWVIAGGESGPGARPMHPDWARSLRDQCAAAAMPVFFKQWGEWAPVACDADGAFEYSKETILFSPGGNRAPAAMVANCDFPDGARLMERVGKKAADRLLDGREHNEFPEART